MEEALSEYISCLERLTSELRQLRKAVDDFKKKCDCAKAVGTSVSTGGTLLAIGSALFAIPTVGLSLLVTGAAVATTVAGAVTNGVTDAINISATKKFIQKSEAILAKSKQASDKLALHLEKMHLEFEDCKQQGMSQVEAAVHAALTTFICVPSVAANSCMKGISPQMLGLNLTAEGILKQGTATASKTMTENADLVYDIWKLFKEIYTDPPAATAIEQILSQIENKKCEVKKTKALINYAKRAYQEAVWTKVTTFKNSRITQSRLTQNNKGISSQMLRKTLKAERLAGKGILKQGTATASKSMAKNAAAVVGRVAIGLNVALQVYDIFELLKEINTNNPAATAIECILSQIEDKICEAKKIRATINDVKRAYQEAVQTEATTSKISRTTQSRLTQNNKDTSNENKSTQAEVMGDRGDDADDEDPKRRPNRRSCENPPSESEANALIELLRELLGEIQGLNEDERRSTERLQDLLDRFVEILKKMYKAGFKASINPKTRNLRLSITINGREIYTEISREGFHLGDLNPSNMGNVFSRVHFGGSSEHIICYEAGAVYYIFAVEEENQHIRYVGMTRRTTHRRVCEEHLRRIARYSSVFGSEGSLSPSDRNVLRRSSHFYKEAGRAASTSGLNEVDQLADLLEAYCMPLQTQEYTELRFWEIIWQWFFSTRSKEGGCNRR